MPCEQPRAAVSTAVMPREPGGYYLYAVQLLGRNEPVDEFLTFAKFLASCFHPDRAVTPRSPAHRTNGPSLMRIAAQKQREWRR